MSAEINSLNSPLQYLNKIQTELMSAQTDDQREKLMRIVYVIFEKAGVCTDPLATLCKARYFEKVQESKEDGIGQPLQKKRVKGLASVTVDLVTDSAKDFAHGVRDLGRAARYVAGCKDIRYNSAGELKKDRLRASAYKVADYIQENKAVLILGVSIAIGVGIALALTGQNFPSLGLPLLGAAVEDKSEEPLFGPTLSSVSNTAPTDSIYSLSNAIYQEAEQRAKEERYPNLVYDEKSMKSAHQKTLNALEKFQNDLIGECNLTNAVNIMATMKGARGTFKKTDKLTKLVDSGIAATGIKGGFEKIQKIYEPLGEAYQQLFIMNQANRKASLKTCERNGYKPHLERVNNPSSIHQTVFVDKNNGGYRVTINASEIE